MFYYDPTRTLFSWTFLQKESSTKRLPQRGSLHRLIQMPQCRGALMHLRSLTRNESVTCCRG